MAMGARIVLICTLVGLGAFTRGARTRRLSEVDVLHVVRAVVVLDLTARPVDALDAEDLARLRDRAARSRSRAKLWEISIRSGRAVGRRSCTREAARAHLDVRDRRYLGVPAVMDGRTLLPRRLGGVD